METSETESMRETCGNSNHIVCKVCYEKIHRCPMCRSNLKNPRLSATYVVEYIRGHPTINYRDI